MEVNNDSSNNNCSERKKYLLVLLEESLIATGMQPRTVQDLYVHECSKYFK